MAKQTTPLHIFKPGTHTDMLGTPRSFTPALLTQIAAAYNPALHEAPLVVGHPRHDLPAYGWVQALTYSDGSDDQPAGLYALPGQVNADFADMVAAGAFKKISAAFYPPDAPGNPTPGQVALRHVGFLGAQPPAIKGLLPPKVMVNFADGDADGLMVFGEDSASTTETTDTTTDVIDPPTTTTVITPGEPTVTEQEAAALKANNAALAAELAALKAQAEGQRIASIHAANLAFCESLVASAKLLPAAKDVLVTALDHIDMHSTPAADGTAQALTFGEGDAKKPLAQALRDVLQQTPAMVAFGEHATKQRAKTGDEGQHTSQQPAGAMQFANADPERMKEHQARLDYMATHKVDYASADRALLSGAGR